MNALFKGLLSVLTGGVSNIFTNGGFSNLGKILNNAGDTANDLGNQNILGNYVAGKTGSRLTDAQREANAWTAEREDIAWNRQLQASNTAYQRQVEDLKSAGLNPMLATGNGVSLPSASTSGSVSPSSSGSLVGDIIQLMQLRGQLALMRSEKELNEANAGKANADAAKAVSETKGLDIINNYRAESEELRLQGLGLTNQLTAETRNKVIKEVDLIVENIRKTANEADTEVERKAALVASRLLSEAQAWQVVQLMPYQKALMSAQSEAARSAALLSAADAAYKNGLIDSGYIEAQLRSLDASATNTEIRNAAEAVKTAFRTGKMPEGYEDTFGPVDSWTVRNILMPLNNVLENINPLAGLIKIAQ